ncbi:MAG TPA: carboxypeptidase-like regulatory domain-containing protein [Solirubrobacteraceae bacterium]|jgi:prepilin-type N-terminal cleavage/methylation domain-containing protein|nr:carboxypeptidase-like regulatory domain-containing protein [Solirubrobacteraceae bacterium]
MSSDHSPARLSRFRSRFQGWHRAGSESGFSLIEVLVSALMVGLIAAAAATALISSAHFSGDQQLRSQADVIANQDLERLRGMSDEQLGGLNQTRTVTLPSGQSFTVTSTSTYVNTSGASSCTSSAASYYKLTTNVSWTESYTNQSPSITDESLLSRPVSGDLLTDVKDPTGAPLQGATVNATGASNQTGTTDSNGCIVFAGLTPGSYTVALSKTGYVDPNGNSAPSGTATVTTTGMASPSGLPFRLGQAGSIVGTFGTYSGAGGQADGLSWLGTGAGLGMTTPGIVTATSAAAGFTSALLYPFDTSATSPATYSSNYQVYGGQCAQQMPPAGSDQQSVSPGSTGATDTIQEPLLDINSVTYNGGAVKPLHIRLTFTGTGCKNGTNDSWYPSLIASPTAAPAPANGWLAYPGQPYAGSGQGTLTVCADYSNHKASVTATNASFTQPNYVSAIAISSSSGTGTC